MKWIILITLPLFLLDQATKWMVLQAIPPYEGIAVLPGFFNLVHTYNTGMAFGLMKNNNLFFTILSSGALVVLVVLSLRGLLRGLWYGGGGLLLAAGILGNLTDRLLHGHVIDFLEFYVGRFYWPAFNVADSCICVSVGLFFIGSFREPARPRGETMA